MNETREIIDETTGEIVTLPQPVNDVRLGGLVVRSPAEVEQIAVDVATRLSNIIKSRGLYSTIQGRNYVRVEGWTTAAAMLGVMAREASVEETDDGSFVAVAELVRASDGMVLGRASAYCGSDENPWGKRPKYARRSMAITRATGKACRLAFSWIVTLAGYEATPAEEMPAEQDTRGARQVENTAAPTHSGSDDLTGDLAITKEQVAILRSLLASTTSDEVQFCTFLKVDAVESIPQRMYATAKRAIEDKKNALKRRGKEAA